ncbi:DUF4093 domain-containing protein [uncultured Subdoligranulum sp.]|uniref:toprim domain-containing protein n=1 Tax=uncultured Subdoligranulum sp. TaxID=512298 RepID=UPI0026222B04|nr:DUF4093 domain-containing protein [uncultured Subdoligranulum sp.]
MLKIQQALLVEGKYDAARLTNLVEGTILTTDGFRVMKDRNLQKMLKQLAKAQGLLILTDSDAAGFKIRHFVTGLVGAQHVLQAYVPAIPGKESRKEQPGKEGLLGVEGVSDAVILQSLQDALRGATERPSDAVLSGQSITYTDLYEWGISGMANSAEKRRVLLRQLGLPPRLSKKELLQVLNTLYTRDGLGRQIQQMERLK